MNDLISSQEYLANFVLTWAEAADTRDTSSRQTADALAEQMSKS